MHWMLLQFIKIPKFIQLGMTLSKGIHEKPTILLALSVIRVLEGHANDPQLTQKEAEILALRGTIKVEGGYRFSRDTRLKEVCRKYCSIY